jgi:hypothetical protein
MASPNKVLTIGTSGHLLDIFLTDRNSGQGITPTNILFRIHDPLGNEVITETAGTQVEVGRYDARLAVIPASGTIGEGWRIDWGINFPGGASGNFSEAFCVQLPDISATFSSPTVNVETIYDRVRVDIGDINAQIFNDGLLRRVLQKAIARLNRRLGIVGICQQGIDIILISFLTKRQRTPITVNLDTGVVQPDSDPYLDLVILQIEEILVASEASNLKRLNVNLGGPLSSGIVTATNEGVSIRNPDGVSISVASSRFSERVGLHKWDYDRINKELEHAIKDFRWRLAGCDGIDITLPRYLDYYRGY